MSETDSLDHLLSEILEDLFVDGAVGARGQRGAAERDERYRARYAALTGRHLPAPREIQIALGYARVAAEYRRRYGVTGPRDEVAG